MPSLAALAAETVAVVDAGRYVSPGGRTAELAPLIEAACAGTCLFTPAELQGLTAGPIPDVSREARIEVSAETTAQACRRLVEADGEPTPAEGLVARRVGKAAVAQELVDEVGGDGARRGAWDR
jgi:hypothetical protein